MRRATCLLIAVGLGGISGAADAPLCCRIFSIDATPILGEDAVLCGRVPDADTTDEAAAAKRGAKSCALDAQSRGRAFVYTYRELIPPDVDLIVGDGTVIERAILDKDCRIGRDVRILNDKGVQDAEGDNYVIRDGIVVIPKGGVVPDGTVI